MKWRWDLIHTIAVIFLLGIIAIVALAQKAQYEWERFVSDHQCKVVRQVLIVTHYKCADGSEYWK